MVLPYISFYASRPQTPADLLCGSRPAQFRMTKIMAGRCEIVYPDMEAAHRHASPVAGWKLAV